MQTKSIWELTKRETNSPLHCITAIDFTIHYCDVIMGVGASQIASLTIVYLIVYSDADQRNIKALHHWP